MVKTAKYTVLSKLIQKIYLSVSGKEASEQASTWPLVFLSQICEYFPAFQVIILVEYPVMSILDKYFGFILKFGPAIFRYHGKTFTEAMFLFAVASNYYQ